MATSTQLPGFWIFMYRISPLTYLISALLSTGIANQAVDCSSLELLAFRPPAGQTCGEYMSAYIAMAGGALADPSSSSMCQFCSLSSTSYTTTNTDLSDPNFIGYWINPTTSMSLLPSCVRRQFS